MHLALTYLIKNQDILQVLFGFLNASLVGHLLGILSADFWDVKHLDNCGYLEFDP